MIGSFDGSRGSDCDADESGNMPAVSARILTPSRTCL